LNHPNLNVTIPLASDDRGVHAFSMAWRRIILWAVVGASLLLGGVAQADGPILTGSTIKIEDATAKAKDVFVGEFTDLGPTVPSSPNMAAFTRATVKVLNTLRGSVKGEIMLEFDIFGINHEDLPKIGTSYFFFVIPEGGRFSALKILPVTEANTALLSKLIQK